MVNSIDTTWQQKLSNLSENSTQIRWQIFGLTTTNTKPHFAPCYKDIPRSQSSRAAHLVCLPVFISRSANKACIVGSLVWHLEAHEIWPHILYYVSCSCTGSWPSQFATIVPNSLALNNSPSCLPFAFLFLVQSWIWCASCVDGKIYWPGNFQQSIQKSQWLAISSSFLRSWRVCWLNAGAYWVRLYENNKIIWHLQLE